MRRLPCFANSQAAGLSWARKSDEVGLGVLAAYSVGYIFEGRGCAPLTWGFPIPQCINTPKMQKPTEAGFLIRTSAARCCSIE